jgi:hypothetical protein
MNKIKGIVDLWFNRSEEAACKRLYPDDCKGRPFLFQPDSAKEGMACKAIWSLIEKSAQNI